MAHSGDRREGAVEEEVREVESPVGRIWILLCVMAEALEAYGQRSDVI